ncbi:sugar ABC transporter permease [Staphylococcus ureilyticus]|uniref:sugar ABC transporter permease n=2 Tax=Staphylococcus TaxID=1279 RepID=UPI0008A2D157|nr:MULTISPECIES: sugar ABC transporter permease [Staphylococcus]OFQ89918.1 sugar ABC transporter permease [Staphylococcus sp. HMSC065A08]OHO39515.1 sugar ABC transporter permease [Staphylococcus sp. HMSC034G07]OLF31431.1 sugar ABC transporter permease [Staphylococcus sp. 47.1]
MIDNLINFYKNAPFLSKHLYHRLKGQWKWFVIPFIISILLLCLLMFIFNVNGTEEIKQARGYFRLAALISFSFIWIAIYQSYQLFKKEYFTAKVFNLNPIFQTIMIAIISNLLMFIALMMIILMTPVNIESSIPSTIYFVIMSIIFVVVISTVFGLLTITKNNVDIIFYILSVIMFFLVPIVYIPSSNSTVISHILMLNPLFYLIEGISQSVVLGALSLNNIPYHFYFIFLMATACALIFALFRTTAYQKYRVAHEKKDTDDKLKNDSNHNENVIAQNTNHK